MYNAVNNIRMKLKHNKLVRLFICPYLNAKEFYIRKKFVKTDDCRVLQSLHNIHKDDETCFILGNGPSLLVEDLEKLYEKRITTFASNRIYNIYNKTNWRPTYYICSDESIIHNERKKLNKVDANLIFLRSIARKYIDKNKNNVIYFCEKFKHYIKYYIPQPFQISEDISKYFCVSGSVITHSIQLAIYMGFRKIYLIGIDHNYSVKVDAKGKITVDHMVKDNFDREKTYSGATFAIDAVEDAFRITNDYCISHSIELYNATRGGKLEIFERKDFDDVMAEL